MSRLSKERAGNYMGDASDNGRFPSAGRGSTAGKNTGNGKTTASFKNGQVLKGLPSHDTGGFPKFPGYNGGGKEQRNSTIGKGSI